MMKTSHFETQLHLVKPYWNIMSDSKQNTHDQNCQPDQLLSSLQDELHLLGMCQKRFIMPFYIPCGIQDVCTKATDIVKYLLSTLSLLEQQLAEN